MADREKVLRYYRGTEGAELAARLLDLAEAAAKSRKFRLTEFLDPYGSEIAETAASVYEGLSVVFDGGYAGAERRRAAFVHGDFPGTVSFEITALKASWNGEYCRLTHRDVLGALLGAGIDRAVTGDILLQGVSATILLDRKIEPFVRAQLTQIGAAGITLEAASLEEIAPREERCKEIKATVASLRVDSVAAAGFGSSRSKIADDIAADKLKLNWQPVKSASQTVKAGDILSMRGRGRLEVAEVRGQTKKGRTGLLLKRYI